MSEHSNPDGKFVFGFLLGGIIGALTIFFLGTKEGKKTGKLLEEKGKDFLDELQDKVDELEHQGKELVKKGEELKEKVVEQMEDKRDTVTQEAAVKMDTALEHIEKLQEHGRETTANLRKRLFKNIPKKK
jgi:gas vesicle protein